MKYDIMIGHQLMGAKIRFNFETRKKIGEKFQKMLLGEVFCGQRMPPHALNQRSPAHSGKVKSRSNTQAIRPERAEAPSPGQRPGYKDHTPPCAL